MKKLGNDQYLLTYSREVVEDHIPALPKSAKGMVEKAIKTRLVDNPNVFGKPLRYGLVGYRSLRVSHYRVIYKVSEDKRLVTILSIKHRKDSYQGSQLRSLLKADESVT